MQTARIGAIFLAVGAIFAYRSAGAQAQPVDDDVQDVLAELQQMSQLLGEAGAMGKALGRSPETRQFSEKMQKDQHAIGQTVSSIAKRVGADLQAPEKSGTYTEARAEVQRLSRITSEEFDREFAKGMVDSYNGLIADVAHTAQNIQDEQTRREVLDILPTLTGHLKEAKRLAEPKPEK